MYVAYLPTGELKRKKLHGCSNSIVEKGEEKEIGPIFQNWGMRFHSWFRYRDFGSYFCVITPPSATLETGGRWVRGGRAFPTTS